MKVGGITYIMEKIYYTVKEVQQLIGCGRDVAYSLVRSKAFPKTKIGKTYFVDKEEFEKWRKKNLYNEFII